MLIYQASNLKIAVPGVAIHTSGSCTGVGLEDSLINCSGATLSILRRANFDNPFRSLS